MLEIVKVINASFVRYRNAVLTIQASFSLRFLSETFDETQGLVVKVLAVSLSSQEATDSCDTW